MLMVIDYSFVNQFWKQCWLLVFDYYLLVIDYQRVKLFGKRFCEKFLCYSMFWKTFLALILIESSLDSWILILENWLNLETWLFLNLDSLRLDSWSFLTPDILLPLYFADFLYYSDNNWRLLLFVELYHTLLCSFWLCRDNIIL